MFVKPMLTPRADLHLVLQGPLEFAATSQKDDLGRHMSISGESERQIQLAVQNAGYEVNGDAFQLGAHRLCQVHPVLTVASVLLTTVQHSIHPQQQKCQLGSQAIL